jgi:hypothetical protein
LDVNQRPKDYETLKTGFSGISWDNTEVIKINSLGLQTSPDIS